MQRKLNRANADQRVQRPIKVLQFGDGNFLRGFADWVIDILNEKTDFNGDVQIVRPLRKGRPETPDDQEGLYHVVLNGLLRGEEISTTRLITCLASAVNPYTEFEKYLAVGENPDLQFIISNTTESGISFNLKDQTQDVVPESFPAKVTTLLYHRFNYFQGARDKGLVLLPCELIEDNGVILQKIVLQYASLWRLPEAFHTWIVECNTFCNSLVDRIVTGLPKENLGDIQSRIGYDDQHIVSAEPFHLWVIESPANPAHHVQQLFAGDQAGLAIKFVKSLAPYRAQKVGILNGAHTTLVPVAYLHGVRTVRESMEDSYTGKFIREAIFDEIIPTLDLPLDELRAFAEATLERFQNPFIRHELKSIALNSVSKFKVRVLPTILEYNRRMGKLPPRLIFSFAALIRFYKGTWKGEDLPLNDSEEVISFFEEAWTSKDSMRVVGLVLSNQSLWGMDLTTVDRLQEQITKDLDKLEEKGVY